MPTRFSGKFSLLPKFLQVSHKTMYHCPPLSTRFLEALVSREKREDYHPINIGMCLYTHTCDICIAVTTFLLFHFVSLFLLSQQRRKREDHHANLSKVGTMFGSIVEE